MTIAPHDQKDNIFSHTQFSEIDIMPIMSYSTFMIFLFIMAIFVVGMYLLGNKIDNGNWGIENLYHSIMMLFRKMVNFTN